MEDHLDREQLLDYLFEEGQADKLDRYTAHLEECLECRSMWLRLCRESREVEELIDSATAEEFGRVVRELRETPAIIRGLARVARDAKVPKAIAEAALGAIGQVGEGMALVIRGLLDSGRHLAALAALQVPRGIQFKPRLAGAGIGSSEGDVAAAGISLGQNDLEGASETLARISGRDCRAVESAEAQIQSGDISPRIVVISGRRQVILTWPVAPGVQTPTTAVLVPLGSPESPLIARFEASEDEPDLVAQFDEVPEGGCDIVTLYHRQADRAADRIAAAPNIGKILLFVAPPREGPIETTTAVAKEDVANSRHRQQAPCRPGVVFDIDLATRTHVRLRYEDCNWLVEHCADEHRTFADGRDALPVRPGDPIRTGDTIWTFLPEDWLCIRHESVLVFGPCARTRSEVLRQCGSPLLGPVACVNLGRTQSDSFDVSLHLDLCAEPVKGSVPPLCPEQRAELHWDIDLPREDMERLLDPVVARLRIRVDGRERPELTQNITVLPPTYWDYGASFRKALAAFVFPNAPAVEELVLRAEEYSKIKFADALAKGAEAAERIVLKALYEALAAQSVTYREPQLLDGEGLPARYQNIRLPHTIRARKEATCLDMALLVAGCMERAGLYPVVVLAGPEAGSPKHALAGCWKGASPGPRKVIGSEELRGQIRRANLFVLETTALAKGFVEKGVPGFDEAMEMALTHMENARWVCGVDIGAARRGPNAVRPLDCRESAIVRDIYARARKVALDRGCTKVQLIHLLYGLLEASGPATLARAADDPEKLARIRDAVEHKLPSASRPGATEKTLGYEETVRLARDKAAELASSVVEEEHLLWAVIGKAHERKALHDLLSSYGWHCPPDYLERKTSPYQ